MFGLLGGIANTYTAVRQGIDDDKRRTAIDEDRQYQLGLRKQQEEDRARRLQIETEDRQFQTGQRQRTLAEQQRTDELRAADAAVPTTRSVVDPNLPTLDDTDNLIPDNLRTREVAVPRWQQLQTLAANRRKAGLTGDAMKLEDAAREEMFKDSSQRFFALRAGAGGMTAFQVAQQAKNLFDNDPYPQEVAGLEQLGNGGVRATIRNRETGQTTTQEFKDANGILTALEGLYSPDTYRKFVEARRASEAKREELLADPSRRFQRVGDSVFDAATGAFRQAPMRQGMEPIGEDENGNPIYRRTDFRPGGPGGTGGGTGAGRAGKAVDPSASYDSAYEFVAKNSNLKDTATPAQIAMGQRLTRQIGARNPGVDPTVAAEAAILAATDPTKVRESFSERTGGIVRVVSHDGGDLVIEDKGPAAIRSAKPGTYAADAAGLIERLGPQAPLFVQAATDKTGKARRELVDGLIRSPAGMEALRQANGGREPTKEQIDEAFKRTDASLGGSLDLLGLHLPGDAKTALLRRAPGAAQPTARRQQPSGGPMSSASDDTLRRIASMPGHARQQEAADELQLRQSSRVSGASAPEPALGFGFGVSP